MTRPDAPAIGPLVRHDDEPVFDDAWQAQVLALAYGLAESGMFSASEWSETLGDELRLAIDRGEPDDHATYYAAALSALERLIKKDGRLSPGNVESRIDAWRRAYRNTPHGEPVELSAGEDC